MFKEITRHVVLSLKHRNLNSFNTAVTFSMYSPYKIAVRQKKQDRYAHFKPVKVMFRCRSATSLSAAVSVSNRLLFVDLREAVACEATNPLCAPQLCAFL